MNKPMEDLIIKSVTKLISGRFLFASSSAYVFVYMSVTSMLPAEDVMLVLTNIITFYFTKKHYDAKSQLPS